MPTQSPNRAVDAVPKLDGDRYSIDFPPYRVEVDPKLGARITAFRLDGRNAFAEAADSPDAFGVTFWPSPQKAWNWPPPEQIDKEPYDAAIRGTTLVLTSRPAPRVGLRVTKEISAEPALGAVRVSYILENVAANPTTIAPWENARMRPRGTTLFPMNGAAHSNSTLKLDESDGFGFLHHDPTRYTQKAKLFADGREGWLAHTDGELLLVFAFEDVPPDAEAPTEGEIEIYVDNAGKFVEVEHQGAYREIRPGAALRWNVIWTLEHLHDTSAISQPGKLVEAARAARARVNVP